MIKSEAYLLEVEKLKEINKTLQPDKENTTGKICGIYKIICIISGKVYIGQSVDCHRRKRDHKSSSNRIESHLYSSIRKYGWDNHKFEILCKCSTERLNELEVYYANFYNCYDRIFGLNNRECGGNSGKISNESRHKMRMKKLGKKQSEKAIENNRIAQIKRWKIINENGGYSPSEKTRNKMSLKKLGKKPSQKNRESMEVVWSKRRGAKSSDITKIRISEGVKLNWIRRRANNQDSHTYMTRQKMSNGNKKSWAKRKSSADWIQDKKRLGRKKVKK